ncbi:MAG: hypothetical protein FJ145_12235 [Deltaproteobacteria bacterium]|nr:hypothetical protein [Deltaproteobacteria bacterium]
MSAFAALLFSPIVAGATQLTFEQIRSGGVVYSAFNDGVVPQDYGDRVTGLTQNVPGGVFTYGNLGEGFTPNIEISYGPYPESASVWWDTFGDLSHVLWNNVRASFQITLVADPGYLAQLHGFDLAGWPNSDYSIGGIEILDGNGSLLFSQANVHVEGDLNGPRHSHFEFAELRAETLLIHIDATNLYSYYLNIGFDNLRFSQLRAGPNPAPERTPEPNAAILFSVALLVAKFGRRRRS